jgi:hypothetical protein
LGSILNLRLAGACAALAAALAVTTVRAEGRGTPPPVHALVAQLEGDYWLLPEQDAPRFGHSLALHGRFLAVGAPGTLTSSGGSVQARGAVFLFRRQDTVWTFAQRITFGSSEPGECGHALALSDRFLVVGCPQHRVSGAPRGRALFYRRNIDTDLFEANGQFIPDGIGGECGYSVAVVDVAAIVSNGQPTAAVGCPNRSFDAGGGLGVNTGSVEVFRWSQQWQFITTVQPAAGGFNNRFGHSVALNRSGPQADPDILLIAGIPGLGANSGGASIFAGGPNLVPWTEERTFTGTPLSRFGHAVHMRGNRLVIGAPEHLVINPALGGLGQVPGGMISIASRSCTLQGICSWNQQQQLVNFFSQAIPFAAAVPQNRLGQSVHALGAARVLAGEPLHPIPGQAGRSRLYSLFGSNWLLAADEPFYADAPAPDASGFGHAVSGDEAWLAIGAPQGPPTGQGRVFVYGYDFDDTLFADDFECTGPFPGCI